MIGIAKRKIRLREARATLEQIKTASSTRARQLLQRVDEVERELDDMLTQWVPDEARVESYCEEVVELQRTAALIRQLNADAAKLEEQVAKLRSFTQDSSEPEVADIITKHCDEWSAILRNIGARAVNREDLEAESSGDGQSQLSRCSDGIKRHRHAVELLVEAVELVGHIGKGPKTAVFEANVFQLRERFLTQGPDQRWLADCEQQLEPVRQKAKEPKPPPPQPPIGLRDIRNQLPEARQWIQALQSSTANVQELADRREQVDREEMYDSPEVNRLRDDVRVLLEKLREEARRQREELQRLTEARAGYYSTACGEDQELEGRLAKLREAPASDPISFDEWKQQHREVKSYFDGIAQTKVAALERFCHGRMKDLDDRILVVTQLNLTDENRDRLEHAHVRVDQFKNPQGREAALGALSAADEIDAEVAKLEKQAREDLVRYEDEKAAAVKRKQDLDEFSRLAGIAIVSSLEVTAPPHTALGRCYELLHLAVAELDRITKVFLEDCAARARENYDFCVVAQRVLSTIPGVSLAALPGPPELPREVREAAKVCEESGKLRIELSRRVEESTRGLVERVNELRRQLDDLSLARAEDIQTAQDLKDMIDSGVYYGETDLTEQLRGLNNLRSRCERFFWDLEKDKREAETKRAVLRKRWIRFFENDLKRYFPEHSVRVAGLLLGIPQGSRDWKGMSAQLDEALRMLTLIEAQAKRIAASELNDICIRLEKRLPGKRGAQREALQMSLAEVANTDEFPSPEIRQKLHDLAEERDA